MKAAEQRFSPEFRNRIDEIVVFSPLTMDEVKQIAQLYLERLNRQMKRQGKSFEVTAQAIDLITEKGYSMQYGARFLETVHRRARETANHHDVEDRIGVRGGR